VRAELLAEGGIEAENDLELVVEERWWDSCSNRGEAEAEVDGILLTSVGPTAGSAGAEPEAVGGVAAPKEKPRVEGASVAAGTTGVLCSSARRAVCKRNI
jgi:hypothetical protein